MPKGYLLLVLHAHLPYVRHPEFDRFLEDGGIWHLWGHSWEIDQLGLWDELAEMLDYVHGREDVLYLNNGDVLQYLATNSN